MEVYQVALSSYDVVWVEGKAASTNSNIDRGCKDDGRQGGQWEKPIDVHTGSTS